MHADGKPVRSQFYGDGPANAFAGPGDQN